MVAGRCAGRDARLCVDLPYRGMDGEARVLPARPPRSLIGSQKRMRDEHRSARAAVRRGRRSGEGPPARSRRAAGLGDEATPAARDTPAGAPHLPEIWSAVLDEMPTTGLVRKLATMTRVGVIAPGSDRTAQAVAQLGDSGRIRADPPGSGRLGSIRSRCWRRSAPTPPGAVSAVEASGARSGRSWTRSTRRSIPVRERRADRASGSCSRSTCRAR